MLDIRFIRDNKELVKERLVIKNFKELNIVDEVIELDNELKRCKQMIEGNQSNINNYSKQIGISNQQKNEIESDQLKARVKFLKDQQEPLKIEMVELDKKFNEKILLLPNLPSPKV